LKIGITTIIESSQESKTELSQRLDPDFPFSYRTSGGGISIFSRLPLISPQSKKLDHGTILTTSIQIQDKIVELIAAHPMVPIKPALFKHRNASLGEIASYIDAIAGKPIILLGDFNLTPWSPYYSQLVGDTKLHNTRLGFGVEPSWIEAATHVLYPNWVTAVIKIPIDHIFVTQDFKVSQCQTAKAANSDHRMLWSDLVL
jgi:endonuclease/exonuclease/phosphatase (EEP) superfamily protein YafD